MSNYTTMLRWVIETNTDIGLKEYPIFDEKYRGVLNTKIKNHYKFREIGFETVELFKHYLNTTMNEIMPYYNQLYLSELDNKKINPYNPFNMNEDFDRISNMLNKSENITQNNGKSSLSNNEETTSLNKNSSIHADTPQIKLNDETLLTNGINATKADLLYENNKINNELNSNSTTLLNSTANLELNSDTTDKYIKSIIGNRGISYGILIKEWREIFINIDLMIIEELNDLFMLVY